MSTTLRLRSGWRRPKKIERNKAAWPFRRKAGLMLGKIALFRLVLVVAAGDHIGAGQPAVQIDVPAARRTKRQRGPFGRLAADRALLRLAGAGLAFRNVMNHRSATSRGHRS